MRNIVGNLDVQVATLKENLLYVIVDIETTIENQ